MAFIKCPICGRNNSSRFSFCLGCGTKMSTIQDMLSSANSLNKQEPKSTTISPSCPQAQPDTSNHISNASNIFELVAQAGLYDTDLENEIQFDYDDSEEDYGDNRPEDYDFDPIEASTFENYIKEQMKYDPEFYYGSQLMPTEADADDDEYDDYSERSLGDMDDYLYTYRELMNSLINDDWFYPDDIPDEKNDGFHKADFEWFSNSNKDY